MTFPRALWELGIEGRTGVKLFALERAAGATVAWLLVGATCWPFFATGLDEVWSMPGVFRIDGLSALGLKACCPCGKARRALLEPSRVDSGS